MKLKPLKRRRQSVSRATRKERNRGAQMRINFDRTHPWDGVYGAWAANLKNDLEARMQMFEKMINDDMVNAYNYTIMNGHISNGISNWVPLPPSSCVPFPTLEAYPYNTYELPYFNTFPPLELPPKK